MSESNFDQAVPTSAIESRKIENGVRKSVEVNDRRWEYLEYGNPDGKQILNIHGWLGSSAEGQDHLSRALAGESQNSPGLQKLAEYKDSDNPQEDYKQVAEGIAGDIENLKGKYHIISPQLPGFGKTEALNDISLNSMADELAAFQKALGIEKAVAIGSSMGGILATKLAARHPEMVEAVVLQGTMTEPKDMQKMPYVAGQIASLPVIRNIFQSAGLDKKLFSSIVKGSNDFKMADEETQNRILSDTIKTDSKTAIITLREVGRNIEKDINKVRCPVIVIDGANGELVPILNSARAATRFHQEISSNSEKINQKKILFLPVGGRAGEQGHNLINTFPEGVAGLVDNALSMML